MTDDFLKQLGHLALASRLKRISDKMIHSGREMYKHLGLDIEPNWYLVFKLLKEEKELSVTEISAALQMSHPSIISIINKMIKSGYLNSRKCQDDGRKQLLSLSDKTKNVYPQLEKIWTAGTQGVAQMVGETDLLELLDMIEARLDQKSFMEMTLENIESNGQ
ncbi:MarR family transcriptional regulator [Fulvivirga sp. RKSG066]|uniref:MarR family winged helix-turn-helix transcriptional regulator n=1 Tax=Fulvivirga aurantia TaxID=2529383 RepID=UPI0012BBAEB0|nr:MarR family transcriptional regulator [Fulvivirga aurantia]MTI20937.1 MarR family transcriptional regulator [Fulvivirga aurantia]